jgi:hypothetical protein
MLHIERILDRLELANARQRADTERERAALAKHRQARAEAREAAARISAEELAGRAAKFEVDLEVERRVRERLEALVTGPVPLPPQAVALGTTPGADSADSADAHPPEAPALRPRASRGGRATGPLFSENEALYLMRRAEPGIGRSALGPKATEDAEVAFWLWRGLAGDRPMLEYTREHADDGRHEMLRMLATYGKGGRKHEMRARHGPRHWIDVADERQRDVDRHNAALPKGHPDRKPAVERMTLRTVKKHFTSLSGYWQWLQRRGVLPRGSNIFDGWDWPGTKGRADDRDDWSADDLNLLLRSSWFNAGKRGTDYWWATGSQCTAACAWRRLRGCEPHTISMSLTACDAWCCRTRVTGPRSRRRESGWFPSTRGSWNWDCSTLSSVAVLRGLTACSLA